MTRISTEFLTLIRTALPTERIIEDLTRRYAYGTDASFYRLTPALVLQVETESEVMAVIDAARHHQTPLTFRAAGTSLSGQAITDSVLVILRGWQKMQIEEEGHSISLQPGVIGAQANARLKPFKRRIGPDPASINTAKIGGIAANNASGMCCGTRQNSYHTLKHLRLVLADGTLLDTRDSRQIQAFRSSHHTLLQQLGELRQNLLDNPGLSEKVRHKYRLKNTTGYGLNALLDFEDPLDILTHLMIGSEGTLGFISEVGYRTVEEPDFKATALLVFDNIDLTCRAVSALKQAPVTAVELIDRRGLAAVADKPGIPDFIAQLPEQAAAILVDCRATSKPELEDHITRTRQILLPFNTLDAIDFSDNQEHYQRLWNIRKGLFPAVGATRNLGSTLIIEDIAFPVEHLAQGVLELQSLFAKYHYDDALIFGHALEGNLHFVFSQGFSNESDRKRYENLMQDVAELVAIRYQGSLKAEHGTGRNMAPFVKMEWGDEGYQLMQQIKQILDPQGILNPGVILNADEQIHLKNLKPMPKVDPLVDQCIECGFCEPVCPSRELTLSPRQRIAVSRRIQLLGNESNRGDTFKQKEREQLFQAYQFLGNDTCAACGMCSTSCPIGINTGNLTRQNRAQGVEHDSRKQKIAGWAANHISDISRLGRTALTLGQGSAKLLGNPTLEKLTIHTRKLSRGRTPLWHDAMPQAARTDVLKQQTISMNSRDSGQRKAVYFSSCVNRTFGPGKQEAAQESLQDVNLNLLRKAGFEVIIPQDIQSRCCGLPFHSKGFRKQAKTSADRTLRALLDASENGRYPILCDTSPCTLRLKEVAADAAQWQSLQLLDTVEFIHDLLLPHLSITPVDSSMALHITCSAHKMGIADKMKHLAKLCCSNIIIPDNISCCGFAGDKGFTLPELNQSALSSLKPQLQQHSCTEGLSNSRSCEIGLSRHGGIAYHNIAYLVNRTSEAAQPDTILKTSE